jgi:hypothetical protein
MTIDGHPIRCEADKHVMRANALDIGDRFVFRAEDLRGLGLTFYKLIAPLTAQAEGMEDQRTIAPDTLVVRWSKASSAEVEP